MGVESLFISRKVAAPALQTLIIADVRRACIRDSLDIWQLVILRDTNPAMCQFINVSISRAVTFSITEYSTIYSVVLICAWTRSLLYRHFQMFSTWIIFETTMRCYGRKENINMFLALLTG